MLKLSKKVLLIGAVALAVAAPRGAWAMRPHIHGIWTFRLFYGDACKKNRPAAVPKNETELEMLKKKLAAGKKQNIAGKELQVIANDVKKFDKTFCESFLSLDDFQGNFSKIPQELYLRFDPNNKLNLTLVESQDAGKKRSESYKKLFDDLIVHFKPCFCSLCEKRKKQFIVSMTPTRNNAIVPYNPAAVAGLLELKK